MLITICPGLCQVFLSSTFVGFPILQAKKKTEISFSTELNYEDFSMANYCVK